MLRGAIDVECKPSSKHLAGEIKNKDDLLTLGPFVETLVAGPTMSIIKSFLVLGRLVARANMSVASGGNGRRATYVDRHTRLTAAPRERPGCSPASPPPEGTFCPSSRSADGAGRAETVGHDRAIQTAGLLYTYILCKRWLLGGLPSAGGLFRRGSGSTARPARQQRRSNCPIKIWHPGMASSWVDHSPRGWRQGHCSTLTLYGRTAPASSYTFSNWLCSY